MLMSFTDISLEKFWTANVALNFQTGKQILPCLASLEVNRDEISADKYFKFWPEQIAFFSECGLIVNAFPLLLFVMPSYF